MDGGASTLVDDLLAVGFRGITALDLSQSAVKVARLRLDAKSVLVTWIAGDICGVAPPAQAYDIWHDRAVVHFLTEARDREAYVRQVMKSVKPGGHFIVATFAPDGPTSAAGCLWRDTTQVNFMENSVQNSNW